MFMLRNFILLGNLQNYIYVTIQISEAIKLRFCFEDDHRNYISQYFRLGCTVTQAVSHWLSTTEAWVRVRAAYGVCGGQSF
jgi:hypothetical protein